jgi:hypothetical protein
MLPRASSLTRVLPPPLSRVPRQETRSGQQRAHRPACDRVQRPHEPCVRREGGEGERDITHTHTHTHTHTSTRASSLCMPLRGHARTWCGLPRRYLKLLGNPDLTCVPLTQERIAAGSSYSGPRVTCQASCLCMPGHLVPCRLSRSSVSSCVLCVLRARVCRVRACERAHLPPQYKNILLIINSVEPARVSTWGHPTTAYLALPASSLWETLQAAPAAPPASSRQR